MISFNRVNALLFQYFFMTYRTIDRLADIFFWPTMAMLLWGFMTEYLQQSYEVNIMMLILSGFIFYQFFQRCQTDISLYLLEDFWSDNLSNVFSTPVTKWDKLVSLVVFAFIKALFVTLLVSLVAFIIFGFNLYAVNLLFLGMFFFSLCFFSIGLGILITSFILKYGTNIQMIAWGTTFLLQPLIAVFYPVSVLPGFLQKIAYMIPATYVFEGLRTLRSTGAFDLNGFFISMGLNCALLIIACFIYSRNFEKIKKDGKMIHAE